MSQVLLSAVSAPWEHMYIPPTITTPIKNKWELIEKTGRVFDEGSWYMSTPLASDMVQVTGTCAHLHSGLSIWIAQTARKSLGYSRKDSSLLWGMRQSQGSEKKKFAPILDKLRENHQANFRCAIFLDPFSLGSWNTLGLTITHDLSKAHKDTGGIRAV